MKEAENYAFGNENVGNIPRIRWLAKYVGIPVGFVGVTAAWCYYLVRGHGMLHYVSDPVEGAKVYYERLWNNNLVKMAKDDRATRQREAYKKALEKKEREIRAQFAEFEIEDEQ